VLALHRLGILHAEAFSTDRGLALQRFVLGTGPSSWESLHKDLESAYVGILALDARLERKIDDYRPQVAPSCEVSVLEDESDHSTVVEVRSQDALGLLYSIASALTGLDLDIQVAKIDTLGSRVVDAFYVRTASGAKLPSGHAAEIEKAIAHRVRVFFGG
jgi:[protein-PII] uridylyltransferase